MPLIGWRSISPHLAKSAAILGLENEASGVSLTDATQLQETTRENHLRGLDGDVERRICATARSSASQQQLCAGRCLAQRLRDVLAQVAFAAFLPGTDQAGREKLKGDLSSSIGPRRHANAGGARPSPPLAV